MKLPNPYIGIPPPPGVAVPDPKKLRQICAQETPRACFGYPPDAPTCWIKYGYTVPWNEVCAQVMAYEGLRQLGSDVRAPAVFYAEMSFPYTVIVMEYIPGKTASECLRAAKNRCAKKRLARSVSLAISELHKIPIAPGTRPAAVSGGKIRHSILFEDDGASRHYETVQQMEDHFNTLFKLGEYNAQFRNLAQEPLVFCQTDLYPDNFIVSEPDGRVTVIDFAETSIVPACFAKLAVSSPTKQGLELRRYAQVPEAKGIDNHGAVNFLAYLLVVGSGSGNVGRITPGGDAETQSRFDMLYSDVDERPGGTGAGLVPDAEELGEEPAQEPAERPAEKPREGPREEPGKERGEKPRKSACGFM